MSSTIDWISARISPDPMTIHAAQRNVAPRPRQGENMKDRLIGTWRLVAATREEIPSGAVVDQLGDTPAGYINYAPDGRMIAIIARGDRAAPAGPLATPEEADALLKSMVAYAGTYTIEGDTVTHHVDISWNESWTGSRQARIFRFDGDRLHLTTPPSPDPTAGKMSVRRMVWEKVVPQGGGNLANGSTTT
jgi:hypothetical protein